MSLRLYWKFVKNNIKIVAGAAFIGLIYLLLTSSRVKNAISESSETVISVLPVPDKLKFLLGKDGPCIRPRIPSLVHLDWLTRKPHEFFRIHSHLCILSIIKNIHPKQMRFYYDTLPVGRFWERSLKKLREYPEIELSLIHTKSPTQIFDKKITVSEHGTDVVRLDAIRKYGGIYMDLDVIVTRNLTSLMCYDMVLGEEHTDWLPNAFMMAVPNSKFAQLWWEEYRNFHENQWNWFSVQIPGQLAKKYPDLVHVERKLMMHPNWQPREVCKLYTENSPFDWHSNWVIHLWYRMYGFYHDEFTLNKSQTVLGQLYREFYTHGLSNVIATEGSITKREGCANDLPRIVYFVWQNNSGEFLFQHFLSVYSVLKHLEPNEIKFYFHDQKPLGTYWRHTVAEINKQSGTKLFLNKLHVPDVISGKALNSTLNKINYAMLSLLFEKGGIYLDLDVIILKNIDTLMCHDTVIGEELYEGFPNTFLMSKPTSDFVRKWLLSYKTDLNSDDWEYNLVKKPGDLAKLQPDLVHWERSWLMKPDWNEDQISDLYQNNRSLNWRDLYFVRLLYKKGVDINPMSIYELNTPLSEILKYTFNANE